MPIVFTLMYLLTVAFSKRKHQTESKMTNLTINSGTLANQGPYDICVYSHILVRLHIIAHQPSSSSLCTSFY